MNTALAGARSGVSIGLCGSQIKGRKVPPRLPLALGQQTRYGERSRRIIRRLWDSACAALSGSARIVGHGVAHSLAGAALGALGASAALRASGGLCPASTSPRLERSRVDPIAARKSKWQRDLHC